MSYEPHMPLEELAEAYINNMIKRELWDQAITQYGYDYNYNPPASQVEAVMAQLQSPLVPLYQALQAEEAEIGAEPRALRVIWAAMDKARV